MIRKLFVYLAAALMITAVSDSIRQEAVPEYRGVAYHPRHFVTELMSSMLVPVSASADTAASEDGTAVSEPALPDSIQTSDSEIEHSTESYSNAVRQKAVDFLLGEVGIKMIALPGGSFSMGLSADNGDSTDNDIVTVDAFEIAVTEITNIQFCAFLNALYREGNILVSNGIVMGLADDYGGREIINLHGIFDEKNKCWIEFSNDAFSVVEGKSDLPVVFVTWHGAMAFAGNYGLDLPTEAEWEYAARGGEQFRYATYDGNISTAKANYSAFKKQPVKVGSYSPNPFGLYDMSGNVWEWCRDWFAENYPEIRPADNPPGPEFGTSRIFKGGGWISRATALQCGFSWAFEPSFKYHNIGFRVIRRNNSH